MRLCTYLVDVEPDEPVVADAAVQVTFRDLRPARSRRAVRVPMFTVYSIKLSNSSVRRDHGDVIYDGLRVLDRSTSLAGAYCAKLLADLGADVVVVEPDGGDPRRRPDGLGDGASCYHLLDVRSAASPWSAACAWSRTPTIPRTTGRATPTCCLGDDQPVRVRWPRRRLERARLHRGGAPSS